MKATGEVMALGRSFEEALLKAVRSLEIGIYGLRPKNADLRTEMDIENGLEFATDERLFLICEAFHRGMSLDEVAQLTNVDKWFLVKLQRLVKLENKIRSHALELFPTISTELAALIREAKHLGFSDRHLAEALAVPEKTVRALVKSLGLRPVYKMVDTCAAEFEAETPYFYSCFDDKETEVTAKV